MFGVAGLIALEAVFGLDIYQFKVDITQSRSKSQIDSVFQSKGRKDTGQPFFKTHNLQQIDTSCVIIQFTPATDEENEEIKNLFGMPGVYLYKRFHYEDGVEPVLVVDNSKIFPVNRDWSVKVSCEDVRP